MFIRLARYVLVSVENLENFRPVSLLLEWSAGLPVTSALKRAVDRVLCSMYVIKPENYISLLENMSIILNVSAGNSLNDK